MLGLLRPSVFGFFAWLSALTALAVPQAEHVFIISFDGGKPSVMQQSEMPVLKQLVAEGAHTWEARTIYPSITLPSHTSMLTGVGPAKHKVSWNDWRPTKGLVRVPSIFTEAKKAGLSTAMFVGKPKFRHFLAPGAVDTFSMDQGHSAEVSKTVAGVTKSTKESTTLGKYVSQNAAAYILEHKPNLCFIHFTDTDNTGHKYGWGSKEQKQAFANLDACLGTIIEAIQDAGIADQSVVIITADHGGHAKTHGLGTGEDMTIPWIAWGTHVKQGFKITTPVITYDTAATALWLLGVAAPKSLDGYPVMSAFD
jgi:predicted AlkP superfamily pyrophosphatase or phosphodiesterase